uniref:GST N-terminal domain-containing protein n=1 Tax=Heterorhabditis bacteriophora TaxID=37862 RepID=A0A1I7XLA1_HETBA
MADHKILPVFAFIDDAVQIQELRQYLNNFGGAKLDENGPADVPDNLSEICSALTVMGACPNPNEV